MENQFTMDSSSLKQSMVELITNFEKYNDEEKQNILNEIETRFNNLSKEKITLEDVNKLIKGICMIGLMGKQLILGIPAYTLDYKGLSHKIFNDDFLYSHDLDLKKIEEDFGNHKSTPIISPDKIYENIEDYLLNNSVAYNQIYGNK